MVTEAEYIGAWGQIALHWRQGPSVSEIRALWARAEPWLSRVTLERLDAAVDALIRSYDDKWPPVPAILHRTIRQQLQQPPQREALSAPTPDANLSAKGVAVCMWALSERREGRTHSDEKLSDLIIHCTDDFLHKWNPRFADSIDSAILETVKSLS